MSSDSDDAKNKKAAAQKRGRAPSDQAKANLVSKQPKKDEKQKAVVNKAKVVESDSDDSDDSEDDKKKVQAKGKVPAKKVAKVSDSEDSSDVEVLPKGKQAKQPLKKKADSSDSDESEEEVKPKGK